MLHLLNYTIEYKAISKELLHISLFIYFYSVDVKYKEIFSLSFSLPEPALTNINQPKS